MSRTGSRIEMNESAFRSLVITKIFLIWIEFKSRREYFNRQFKKKRKFLEKLRNSSGVAKIRKVLAKFHKMFHELWATFNI